MSQEPRNTSHHPTHPEAAPGAPATRISSEDLLCGRGELIILHQGREYRLRITQNGKLLLTA